MKWIELKIRTTEEAGDAVSEMLSSVGAGGVVIEDPNDIRKEAENLDSKDYIDQDFLDSLGDTVVIKAYFHSETVTKEKLADTVRQKLTGISEFLDTGEGFCGCSEVDDADWATSWKKYYKPFHITDRFVIRPSWEDYDIKPGETVIELDPGMAFGTGTHETTRLCSKLIEKYVKPNDYVIDVGCGTGILSIMAAKLGAGRIEAFDTDEAAVRIADENCRINKAGDSVDVRKGEMKGAEGEKADIIAANIIADVIIGLAGAVLHNLKRGGYFIASGIIRERKDEVCRAYSLKGFDSEEVLSMGEWVAIVFRCRDSL